MWSDASTRDEVAVPPSEVHIDQRSRTLTLRWPGGPALSVSHARLRRACRCAGCESQRRREQADPPCDPLVDVQGATPIGEMGLQLHFSDGHERGIYPWPYLRQLAG